MKFYLGVWRPNWGDRLSVPFMLSARVIVDRYKEIKGDWILDSGGFVELSKFGEYTISLEKYLKAIKRFDPPDGAFCQDWMCEGFILEKTQKTIEEHQRITTENYIEMASKYEKAIPVLQGWTVEDYVKHAESYDKAGVKLDQLFGLGSVCSRSKTNDAEMIITGIKREIPEVKLHGFGIKTAALKRRAVIDCLESADSSAWSFQTMYGEEERASRNSVIYAEEWYDRITKNIEEVKRYKPAGYLWND